MNDHDRWEENVRARRNFILLAAGGIALVLALLLFWFSNRTSAPSAVATLPAEEGAQAQPTLPDVTPPTPAGDIPALNPDLAQRTLPVPTPTVGAVDNPPLDQPARTGERIVIGGNVVDQFEAASAPPDGWAYLPEFGISSIFQLRENGDGEGHTVMLVNTAQDAGVLQKEVNVPLDPDTTLRWQWNVLDLPSDVPEDSAGTHDYFGIAVRFDNGQDLVYMWSADLLTGTSFRCPLPEWNQRETHLVVRTGESGLNQWLGEERSVLADYERYIGGDVPALISHVWLVASSAQQNGEGRAVFRQIAVGGKAAL